MNAFAGCRRDDATQATTDTSAAPVGASSSSLASTARDARKTTVEIPVGMVVSTGEALPEHAGKNGCIAQEPTAVPRLDDVSCAELEQMYGAALHRTGTCGCDADCSVAVCADLCCKYKTFVNPKSARYRWLNAIRRAHVARRCPRACEGLPCPAPASGSCFQWSHISPKHCTNTYATSWPLRCRPRGAD
jgi:hypothetical protein